MRIVNENVLLTKEQGGKFFLFSVVMAAYNVDKYIAAAIDSLIEQDFGFENIQLVIVDDGSADATAGICDRYAEQYPDNIAVIHKENGGVSSARNEGLRRITGQYVNFLDADDKLTPNTFSTVYEFLEKNSRMTDVVSFPIVFFDNATGDHPLNFKFDKGARIIDLQNETAAIQMSTGASFIRADALRDNNIWFDERLCYAEDAKFLQKVLNIKKTLGVVNQCKYMHRRRKVNPPPRDPKAWWLDYMRYFQLGTAVENLDEDGLLPKFIQETLSYDMQRRVKIKTFNHNVLNDDDIREYKELVSSALAYIDDSVIMGRKAIFAEHKLYLLKQKYRSYPEHTWYKPKNRIVLSYNDRNTGISLNTLRTELKLLETEDNEIVLCGRTRVLDCGMDAIGVGAFIDDNQKIPGEWMGTDEPETILDDTAVTTKTFCVKLPLTAFTEKNKIKLYVEYEPGTVTIDQLFYGELMPLSPALKNEYVGKNGVIITCDNSALYVAKASAHDVRQKEALLQKELYKANKAGMRKAVLARRAALFMQRINRDRIWLIMDRYNKAGDNGEALFRYMCERKDTGIKCYFVLSKDSSDFQRLAAIGPVIEYGSHQHKLLHLRAERIISSSGENWGMNPFGPMKIYYRNMLNDKKYVFLQHGVTKDNLAGWLNKLNKNIKGFITSARPEYESILQEPGYCYTEKEVWLTGMPRFDRLYNEPKKKITIMPTWRKYLLLDLDTATGLWKNVQPGFGKSQYVTFWHNVLNNETLLKAAGDYGYTIQFLPHPHFMRYVDQFRANPAVEVLHSDKEYRDVFAESDLVVTDYSSTIFDFVYLYKPVIYAQFDKETFFSGEHTYKKGYFDYEKDGFGEVEYSLKDTVDRIIEYMKNGCQMKKTYRDRVDSFFAYHDQNNCQRVYEKIRDLDCPDTKQ